MKMKLLRGKIPPGSVFYIPALGVDKAHGFVLARFIEDVDGNAGALIEVFSKFYTALPSSFEDSALGKRLFRPILCSMRFSEIPRWRVLYEDPSYNRARSNYEDIVFEYYSELWIGGQLRKKNESDFGFSEGANAYEWSTCWRMHHVIFRVNAYLAGVFSPEEAYDENKLPFSMHVSNPEAVKEVVSLAEEIDELFKAFSGSVTKKGC